MKSKTKFKETEIRKIPEDWTVANKARGLECGRYR
jgi:hypothetical protein